MTRDPQTESVYQRGVSSYKKGDLTTAQEAMRLVLRRQGDDPDALYFLSLCLLRLDKNEEALPLLLSLVNQKANDFYSLQGHMLSALVHVRKGRLDEGETALHALLQKNFENAQVYSVLGYIYHMRRDQPQAEYYYQKALSLDRHNANAHNGLGNTYLEWPARRDEALPHFEKAMSQHPGYPAYLDSLGWYHHLKENVSRALFYIQKAFRLKPHPIIKEHFDQVRGKESATASPPHKH